MRLFDCFGCKNRKKRKYQQLLNVLDNLIRCQRSLAEVKINRNGDIEFRVDGEKYQSSLSEPEFFSQIAKVRIEQVVLKFEIEEAIFYHKKNGGDNTVPIQQEQICLSELLGEWRVDQFLFFLSDFYYCFENRLDFSKISKLAIDCSLNDTSKFKSLTSWLTSDTCKLTKLVLNNISFSGTQINELKKAVEINKSLNSFECDSAEDQNTINQIIKNRQTSDIECEQNSLKWG